MACLQVATIKAFSMVEGAKVLGMEMMSERVQGFSGKEIVSMIYVVGRVVI